MGKRGETNNNAKMTTAAALRVCNLLSVSDAPYREIAAKAGVTQGQVEGIAKRQTWTHISGDYTFKRRAVSARRGR